jgi:short/branched chain acyl-CoA dehydrogenase
MNFDLSEEHEAFRLVVRDFAEKEIAPYAARWDEEHMFPLDAVEKMADLGLFGLVFPEEWGGSGGDFVSLCIAIEEIGRVDQSMGITLSAGVGLGANPIFRFGTPDQKQRWLPELVAGKRLGAFGLTEPDAGSDAGATRTRAQLDGDNWVINGTKSFITNSGTPITSVITVTARTDDGISSFVIEAGTPGLTVEPAYRKLGWHASDTHGSMRSLCRITTCSVLLAKASEISSPSSTTDELQSQPSRSAALAPASNWQRPTHANARRSVARSAATRASPSPCPTSPSRSKTRRTSPTRQHG